MKDIKDEILIKALELQERGEPLERIYETFPEAAGELREIFELTADLREEARRIEPPSRELLQGALRRAAAHAAVAKRPILARVPMAVRILAPAFAVALLVFFGTYSPGTAPSSLIPPPGPAGSQPADRDAAGPEDAGQETAPARMLQQAAPEASLESSALSQTGPDAQDPAAATMQAAPPADQGDSSAGAATAYDDGSRSDPSALADQVADSYVMAAEEEETTMTEQ